MKGRKLLILQALARGMTARRTPSDSWKWEGQRYNNPPLRSEDTSALFRADLVEEVGGKLQLTSMGSIIEERERK